MDKQKLGKYLSNRNLIIAMGALFVIWLSFFDQDSYMGLRQADSKIAELEKERDFYLNKISQDSMVVKNIEDSAFLVKFARENYFFIEQGEVLYLVEGEDDIVYDTYKSGVGAEKKRDSL